MVASLTLGSHVRKVPTPATELAEGATGTTYATAAACFAAANFDPTRGGNASVVLISDTHLDPPPFANYDTPVLDARLVADVNSVAPTHLIVNGDNAVSLTEFMGQTLTPTLRARGLVELARAQSEYTRLTAGSQHILLGNHDQYNYDTDGSVWQEVFVGLPRYKRVDVAGLPFLMLNGNHSGEIEAAQKAWLISQLADIGADKEIAICLHQPTINVVAAERVNGQVLREVFANHSGKLWIFVGHAHTFSRDVCTIGNTTLMQYGVTTANPLAFNDGKNPGLLLMAVQRGKLKRVWWRDCKTSVWNDYACLVRATATAPLLPWQGIAANDFILKLEEGSYDRATYLVSRTSDDAKTWLSYFGAATWKLPLSGGATKVRLLASALGGSYTMDMSNDGAAWTAVTGTLASSVWTMTIPVGLRAGQYLYYRANINQDRYNVGAGVAGIALTV